MCVCLYVAPHFISLLSADCDADLAIHFVIAPTVFGVCLCSDPNLWLFIFCVCVLRLAMQNGANAQRLRFQVVVFHLLFFYSNGIRGVTTNSRERENRQKKNGTRCEEADGERTMSTARKSKTLRTRARYETRDKN